MPSLFGVNIASIVKQAIGPGVRPATLIVVTQGSRTDGSPAAGRNATEQSIACRGVRIENRGQLVSGELVGKDDAIILLVADSITGGATPKTSDKITIEGRTRPIVRVEEDPARATFTCVVQG